jgi:hypothetical protein
MMPRLEDKRVGYFTVDQVDYGTSEQRAAKRSYINRYRLECAVAGAPAAPAPAPIGRDSAARLPADSAARAAADSASPATAAPAVPAPAPPAAVPPEGGTCVPQKPIAYYVDPATPKWLVPWIKRGIEAWQPAFEAAGFRDAIVARDAPTAAEDPDWSAEDARYSVIRWLPSTIENAQGPNVVDPRSGEILEADVRMYHNVMNLNRAWYFTQVGPLDPRARRLPLPDSLMGPAHGVRGGARGGAHARLPAQHEGERHLRRRLGALARLRGAHGAHADADGLLALQLRRAARGLDPGRGARAEDRAVRPVRDDVGLPPDPRRAHARGRAPRCSTGGRGCRTRPPTCASRPAAPRAPTRARRPRRWATPTR